MRTFRALMCAAALLLVGQQPLQAAHPTPPKKHHVHKANKYFVITQPGLICQNMYVTAYTAASSSYGPTASGRYPRAHHTVAAYWPQLPKFTWVEVYGLGYFQVEDTGGAIGWNRLDIFTSTNAEAYAVTGTYKVCWNSKPPVG